MRSAPCLFAMFNGFNYFLRIAFKIADMIILLRKKYFHCAKLTGYDRVKMKFKADGDIRYTRTTGLLKDSATKTV